MEYENNEVLGYKLGDLPEEPVGTEFWSLVRSVGAEGIVMLKNDGGVLPLQKSTKISLFGRLQSHYYKSGTGSGGLVNVDYVVNILDGLKNAGLTLNEKLAGIYAEWENDHPFDLGKGWASEPWCQEEMPLDTTVVSEAASCSDVAVVIIGRTAGEDKDNSAIEGSYLLSDGERDMLSKVCSAFKKVIVVLNVGNIIDMKWVNEYDPSSVLYVWQGGQEGGNSLADVLIGNVTPSGKLADTIAYDISDYPSTKNFGNRVENRYCEDIYVGYRYFSTFAPEKVLYPFGFGLSYTTFEVCDHRISENGSNIDVSVSVKNTGSFSGKEVVQVYYGAPQGKLGKPQKALAGFAKTSLLAPGETETLKISFPISSMASYDDSGLTGNKSCYVLESGMYVIYVGTDSASAEAKYSFVIDETEVVELCCEAMAPVVEFNRIRPIYNGETFSIGEEPVPQNTVDLKARIALNCPDEIEYTGDKGLKLIDVKNGKCRMEDFIAQFTDEDLACISRGEGMNSPKVTGGTGCAFGGVTERLLGFGIPIACGTDGPSGIRMDTGARATAMPNGTLIACTWNEALAQKLYVYEGIEMASYKIDTILGPGINIHRNPLNGRNFEYFSEDPLLTGKISAAICRGLAEAGVCATIKHFCGNNQEVSRGDGMSVISERALREIYLKAFEISVKEGNCVSIMTAYTPVNGHWSAANYDLNTTILRGEWGYRGFVMTDWWARTNSGTFNNPWCKKAGDKSLQDLKIMVEAQNDIFMVTADASDNDNDNITRTLADGSLNRGMIQRNAANLCRYLMTTHAFERFVASGGKVEDDISKHIGEMSLVFAAESLKPEQEAIYDHDGADGDKLAIRAEIVSNASALAQSTIQFYINGKYATSMTVNGTNGETITQIRAIKLFKGENRISVKYPDTLLSISKIELYK